MGFLPKLRNTGASYRIRFGGHIFGVGLSLALGASCLASDSGKTGEASTVTRGIPAKDGMGYYLMDWGDGFLTASALRRDKAPVTLSHRWTRPGSHSLVLTRQSLAGQKSALPVGNMEVTGGPWAPQQKIVETQFSSGETVDSVWSSGRSSQRLREEWLAVKLAEETPLEALWIDSRNCPDFPSAFRVEYSLDGGETWLRVPTAVFFRFPNPDGRTVEIPLHNLMANAVRVVATVMRTEDKEGWRAQFGALKLVPGSPPTFSWKGGVSGPESASWNNLWTIFGEAASEVNLDNSRWLQGERPFEGGVAGFRSAEWLDWLALKFAWRDHQHEQEELGRALRDMVVDKEGFVWASPADPRHLNHSRHYTTNASFISAVAEFYLWNRDRGFLTALHGKEQESLLSKARRAMDYQLKNLEGASGLLTIRDPDNDGTNRGLADNYWDFWRFGYQTAYGNVLFYRSLLRMAELEDAVGEQERAQKLREIAARTKEKFNEVFWNAEKGRFIGGIDVNGVRRDYGFVFVNLHAVAEGIVSDDREAQVMNWIAGTRILPGEASTGPDIYHFRIAPRSTTVSASEGEAWYETWNGALKVGKGDNAAFGLQMQNGGAIFYLSYYDLLARGRVFGAEDAWQRMKVILEEFQIDQLRRDPSGPEAMTEIVGVVGEFPESGLVPAALLPVWLGVKAESGGLRITPRLPDKWERVTVRGLRYAGRPGDITVGKDISEPSLQYQDGRWNLLLPAEGRHLFTPDFKIQ